MQQTSNSSSTEVCQGSMGINLSIDLLPDAKQLNMVDKSAFLLRLHGRIQCIAAYTHSLCTEETLQNECTEAAIPDLWNVWGESARRTHRCFPEFLLSWTSQFLAMQLHRIPVLLFL